MKYYEYEIIKAINAKIIEEQKHGQEYKNKNEDEKPKNHNNKCKWTSEQKQWLLERDEYRCRLNGCENTTNLQGHHIIASQYAINVLGLQIEQINAPLNGIILCGHCHRTIIHQEITIKHPYKVKIKRRKFLEQRPYWNTVYDKRMEQTAKYRTERYLRLNPDNQFPVFSTT